MNHSPELLSTLPSIFVNVCVGKTTSHTNANKALMNSEDESIYLSITLEVTVSVFCCEYLTFRAVPVERNVCWGNHLLRLTGSRQPQLRPSDLGWDPTWRWHQSHTHSLGFGHSRRALSGRKENMFQPATPQRRHQQKSINGQNGQGPGTYCVFTN